MMLLCGQVNRVWHFWAGRNPGSVGVLISPSYGKIVPIDPWMPFVLDNGAFTCWRDKKPWDLEAWLKMLQWIRLTGQKPLWAAVPDVVANREATIENWSIYAGEIKRLGWPAAFCVQDGMTPEDVPEDADVIFVGGTDKFKLPTLKMWCKNFNRVHCARVNSRESIEYCESLGCESVDGTGWFRDPSRQDKVPMLKRFIEGKRFKNDQYDIFEMLEP